MAGSGMGPGLRSMPGGNEPYANGRGGPLGCLVMGGKPRDATSRSGRVLHNRPI